MILWTLALLFCLIFVSGSSHAAQVSTSYVSTDTSDYAPFDTVWISATGFWANETVTVQVTHHDGYPEGGEGHDPWNVNADNLGEFVTYWVVPPDDQVDETLLVTCTGQESGIVATTLFTDANSILEFTTNIPDTLTGGTTFQICANLSENCGGGNTAPLAGREILFFFTSGNCGVNVGQNADDTVITDANGNACATVTLPMTAGDFGVRVKFRGEDKPKSWEPPNSACDPTRRTKLSASNECRTFYVDPNYGTPPIVDLGPDTVITQCTPEEICLDVDIIDNECDVDTVYTNFGDYLGTMSSYDQVSWINALGGTVTQIGGGAPGSILSSASDFVAPVNSQSGVSVTLPNFVFGATVDDPGSFPTGLTPGNSATHLLGSPTDLTFTKPGPGGPDGGDGDGSIDFATGNYATIGFGQDIRTCNGSNSDFIVFTNSDGGGTGQLQFLNDGLVVHTDTNYIPAHSAGSGIGSLNLDLPDNIVFDAIELTALSGRLEVDGFAARITPSPSTQDLCFTPDTSGVYTIEVTAEDASGMVGSDVVLVTVNLNQAPVADAGPDQTIIKCDADPICLPVACTDADNNLASSQLLSGPGSLSNGEICFNPTSDGTYEFIIRCVDSCGLSDRDTVAITVFLNEAPVAVDPDTVSLFLCAPVEQCYTFSATDGDGDDLTWTKIAGVGAVDQYGEFCFTPTTSGTYGVSVAVTDSCGAADTVSIVYDITINSAPTALDPSSPIALFQCAPAEVCYQFVATDPNGGSLTWTKLTGSGSVSSSGLWCFTPTGSGTYAATVVATDSCGRADTTDLAYDVTVNNTPTIALGNDITVQLCAGEELCLDYTVNDAQGLNKLTEVMEAGFGGIDTAANQICFTPTGSGDYEFIVSVTDSCGATAADTQTVTVEIGDVAAITCPTEPVDVSLCNPEEVCYMLGISPSGATVTTSFGTYSGGELCFDADTSGTYLIEVIADAACGADTCQLTFNVEIGSAAQIACPTPQSLFICEADNVCVPLGVMGAGATVTVSPIGSYSAGNVCFPADTSGHYEITVIAATDCGSDTCVVVADITINDAPVASAPASPADTFVCDPGPVCYQFGATDANGGTLTFSKISGNGAVDASGEWCFNATGGGSYSVTARVVDDCGAADTVSLTVNVGLNQPPVVSADDATLFMCIVGQTCLPITLNDPDGNLASYSVECGTGTIDTADQKLCFTPDTAGVYKFCLVATDECGETVRDTVRVTVDVNDAPVVDLGNDTTVFGCDLSPVCLPVSVTDADNNIVSINLLSGPGSYANGEICFTPTGNESHTFILEATDDCGQVVADTIDLDFILNSGPVADAGADATMALCTSQEICLPVSCTDIDGNLASCLLLSGPGAYNGSEICFTPTAAGTYEFIIEATDDCGETDRDTVVIDVTINSGPVCTVPNDTSIFQCTPTEVCLPAFGTDADGNLQSCNIVSGPGSLVNGEWCYTPVGHQIVTVVMECVDDCGVTCQSSFTVEFNVNGTPSLAFGNDTTLNLCASQQICVPYSVDDPDLPNPMTITQISGPGILDTANSRICFTPTASGTYTFVARVEDGCGLFDQDTINVTVNLNALPVADAGPDQTVYICTPGEQICWPASCTDPSGNLTGCSFTGPGTYDGTEICFTPTADGTYEFIVEASDACGEVVADTAYITVEINQAPVVTLPADSALALCGAQEVCFDYTVGDGNTGDLLVESMVSGFGSIDTATNQVCFTPTSSGSYEFVLSVTDSCGATDTDTIVIDVDFGDVASVTCPAPLDEFLCSADSIVVPVTVSPSGATVSVSYGIFDAGTVRFLADTAGTYTIDVIASGACGDDTCQVVVTVDFNAPPVASAGADQSVFQCAPAPICLPASSSDPDGNLSTTQLVSGPGSYNGSEICFTPAGAGTFEFVLEATDACGATDRDTVEVTVTINSAPLLTAQNDTTLQLCGPQEICVSYTASDLDHNAAESMQSGYGTLDTSANEACFTPTGPGTYQFVFQAVDDCGERAADTVVVTVEYGEMASIDNCPTGPIAVSLCTVDTVCYMLDVQPASATVTPSFGSYANGELCFVADTSGIYEIEVIAEEACGSDTCVVRFNVSIGSAAELACPAPQTREICGPGSVCIPISAMGTGVTYTVSPIGSYSGGNLCFPADTSGNYQIEVIASSPCGDDTCLVEVDVTINSAPVATDPSSPIDQFLCATSHICYQFAATDVENDDLTWSRISGDGSVSDSGEWCFNATATGSYSVTAAVTDDCGGADTVTLTYNVTINSRPVVDAGSDQNVSICSGDSYCFTYSVTDADAHEVTEQLLVGPGTIDTVNNEVCFTPAVPGAYEFVVKAIDDCNKTDVDTVIITVDFDQTVALNCPSDTAVALCAPGQICRPLTTTPSGFSIAVTPIGSVSNGQFCFTADTSGTYVFEAIATSGCNADTCQFTVDVTVNGAPVAVDPTTPIDTAICAAGQVCYQFTASDPETDPLTWTRLSGAGTVSSSGEWCFNASADGQYCVTAQVSDGCGAADTVTLCYNIDVNAAPVAGLPNDGTVFQCDTEEICLNYTATDSDNNVTSELLLTGVGTIDTVANSICFTPDTVGVYTFVLEVTDACGATDRDTVRTTIELNNPPTVAAAFGASLFRCDSSEICLPVTCSDPDNNLDSCWVVGGLADYNFGEICFVPDTAGTYEFIIAAIDQCGETAYDTATVTIDLNDPPVCNLPGDAVITQCAPTQISLPVGATDDDGNLNSCEIVSGPGSLIGGNWVFTPTTDADFWVKILCIDDCGAVCQDSFHVDIDLNSAPVADAGPNETLFLCQLGQQICVDIGFSDAENNIIETAVHSPTGASITGNQVCFSPTTEGVYEVVIRATDSCGATDYDTSLVTVDFNDAPTLNLPTDPVVYLDDAGQVCVLIDADDDDGNLSNVAAIALPGAPSPVTPTMIGDQLCFDAGGSGEYCFEVTATDGCGATDVDTMCVEVQIDECIHVRIEKTHGSIQGQHELVDILLESNGKQLGGFDLLISYDYSALTLNTVIPGDLIEQCGWEYFVYRHGADGNCGGGCPSGAIRIVSIAETNNGPNHPGCLLEGLTGSLATIDFVVSNDRTLECQYAPVQFLWADCGDNAFSGPIGDTLWVSRDVYSFELNNIADNGYGFPGYFGAPDYCLIPEEAGKPHPLRCIDFTNGGVDIVCADSIDARADLNLNGIPYEVADAVLYSNYFVTGLSVFQVNVDGQIAASDVNADGITLSVADLVYLIRVVTGDASPFAKVIPGEEPRAAMTVINGVLTVAQTDAAIGALYMTVEGKVQPILHENASGMDLKYEFEDGVTRILVYDLSGTHTIDVGEVLMLEGSNYEITTTEVGSYDGRPMVAKLNSLPSRFALSQNYPNPFNPVTTIEFALPVAVKWELTVYNVLGQVVKSFSEEGEAGYHKIAWDAGRYASGVYLYRLTAGDFSQTRKMVLLK